MFLDQRSNLSPLHWEHGVSATRAPRKSLIVVFEAQVLNVDVGNKNSINNQVKKKKKFIQVKLRIITQETDS